MHTDPAGAHGGSASPTVLDFLIGVVRRRWLILVAVIVAAAGSSLVISLSSTTVYSSTAQILFRSPGFDQLLSGSSALLSSLDPARQAATNAQLVSTGYVAKETGRRLGRSRQFIQDHSEVIPSGDSDLVRIVVTHPDPEFAARAANVFAQTFIDLRRAADREKIGRAQAGVARQLRRTSANNEAERQLLSQRLETLRTLNSLQTGNAEIVQPAEAPTSPSGPRTKRNLALALIIGLVLGFAVALLRDRFDRGVRDLDEVSSILGLPLLGAVPQSRKLEGGARGLTTQDRAMDDAFRSLRASLRYFNVDRALQVLLVTSAVPGEGKTTIAAHLATSFAASGVRTLLVESDMRRPQLAGAFGVRALPGLSEVLTRQSELDEAARSISDAVDSPKDLPLDLLVAGGTPPNSAELLESARMRELLDQARAGYQMVVIDSPPLLVVPDVAPLLSQVDGVVIVARVGRTQRDVLSRLSRQLVQFSAPALGCVVNGFSTSSGYYGYYGYAGADENQRDDPKLATKA